MEWTKSPAYSPSCAWGLMSHCCLRGGIIQRGREPERKSSSLWMYVQARCLSVMSERLSEDEDVHIEAETVCESTIDRQTTAQRALHAATAIYKPRASHATPSELQHKHTHTHMWRQLYSTVPRCENSLHVPRGPAGHHAGSRGPDSNGQHGPGSVQGDLHLRLYTHTHTHMMWWLTHTHTQWKQNGFERCGGD